MDYIYGYKENFNKFSLREIYKPSLFVDMFFYHNKIKEKNNNLK